MKKLIVKVIKQIFDKFPLKKVIIFESIPDFSDNTMPVFKEMVRRGYNKKYKMIWACSDDYNHNHRKIKNVHFIQRKKQWLLFVLLNYGARATICCNGFTGSDRKGQDNFYLCHGAPLKDHSSYFNAPSVINHVIASSEYMVNILAEQLKVDIQKITPLGFPRNDVLLNKKIDLRQIFGNFEKFIVWYPTVKTFKDGKNRTGCVQPIQFIWDIDHAKAINNALVKNNTLLIIKPHFAQMTGTIKSLSLTNFKFIDDKFFVDNGITSYEMIGGCDALLTDYSSVYYDYLLCNRPVGFIWEDIDEYSKSPGLIKEYEFVCSGGVKIFTCNELCSFIDDVHNGNDVLREQRKKILPYIHCSDHPDNTKRVVDYIVSVLNL